MKQNNWTISNDVSSIFSPLFIVCSEYALASRRVCSNSCSHQILSAQEMMGSKSAHMKVMKYPILMCLLINLYHHGRSTLRVCNGPYVVH